MKIFRERLPLVVAVHRSHPLASRESVPLLEIGSCESIREAVLRNIGISIIARHEVPHNLELRVLSLQGASQEVSALDS